MGTPPPLYPNTILSTTPIFWPQIQLQSCKIRSKFFVHFMAYSRMDKLCLEQSREENLTWGLLIDEFSMLILANVHWAPLCARNFTNTATFHLYDHCYFRWSLSSPSKWGWGTSVEPDKSPWVTELASGRAGTWTKVWMTTKWPQVIPQHLVSEEWVAAQVVRRKFTDFIH